MKKLQIALDELSLPDALELIEQVRDHVDIVEIGTPFVIDEGMHAVRAMREAFPDLEILADTKIMDAGEYEADLAFDAGADYVTVLGVSDLGTIKGCLESARKHNRHAFVDMVCVPDLAARVAELEAIGVRDIAVHVGVDLQAQGRTPLEDLKTIKAAAKQSRISVAGGINADTLPDYLAAGADVVIVGGGIAHAADPAAEANRLADIIHAEAAR